MSEFARCYHSKERVEWVKSIGCVFCAMVAPIFGLVSRQFAIHNAHTENEGKGRKGHYSTIVPLCSSHHRAYDEYRKPFDTPLVREHMKLMAQKVEARWQEYNNTHTQEKPQ